MEGRRALGRLPGKAYQKAELVGMPFERLIDMVGEQGEGNRAVSEAD
jgi:hypothetical protein